MRSPQTVIVTFSSLIFSTLMVVYSVLSSANSLCTSTIDTHLASSLPQQTVPLNYAATDSLAKRNPAPIQQQTGDSLAELNSLSPATCSSNFVRVSDTHIPASHDTTNRKIPKIVFQTSRSRCLTPKFEKFTAQWRFEGWSYYFYDDDAIRRLLHEDFPEFPHLKLITENCIDYGTIKADLFRYLVLWKFGGLYVDIDSVPSDKFTIDLIKPEDDSFFVVENINLLSQYFMAVSPRHPLIFYAIQRSLANLLTVPDTGEIDASIATGPIALHWAFVDFRRDVGVKVRGPKFKKVVTAGFYEGTQNRTVTVIGKGLWDSNEWVIRETINRKRKIVQYEKMGMTHHQRDKLNPSNHSCYHAILHNLN